MILIEWFMDCAIEEICFDFSTFFVQIHDILPGHLKENNALKIGSTMGRLLGEGNKSVISYRYLRVRVETLVGNPIPIGFL